MTRRAAGPGFAFLWTPAVHAFSLYQRLRWPETWLLGLLQTLQPRSTAAVVLLTLLWRCRDADSGTCSSFLLFPLESPSALLAGSSPTAFFDQARSGGDDRTSLHITALSLTTALSPPSWALAAAPGTKLQAQKSIHSVLIRSFRLTGRGSLY